MTLALRRIWSEIDKRFDDQIKEEQYQKSLNQPLRVVLGVSTAVLLLGAAPGVFATLRMKEQFDDGTCFATYMQAKYVIQYVFHAFMISVFVSRRAWMWSIEHLAAERLAVFFLSTTALLFTFSRYHAVALCGAAARPGVFDSFEWLLAEQQHSDHEALVAAIALCVVTLVFPIRNSARMLVIPALLVGQWVSFLMGHSAMPLIYLHLLLPVAAYGGLLQQAMSREKWSSLQKLERQSASLQDHYAAACSLLSRLCDCVLQVDEQMTIVDSNRNLEAMLFMRSQGCIGRNLKELCADDDPNIQFISESEPGECSIQPLRFRSSDGGAFSVSCYAVPFDNPGDGKRYLLGMTESFEERVPESRRENDFKMPSSPETQILGKPSVEDSESNVSSLAAVVELGEVSATVEISPGLPIHASSEEFALLKEQELSFEALVARPDSYTRLQEWLGEFVREFLDVPPLEGLPLKMGYRTFFAKEVRLKSMSMQAGGRIFVRLQICGLRRIKTRTLKSRL